MRVLIKIIRALLTVILCVVVALNLWMIVQQTVLHRDTPELFGYSQYIVTSGSMEPSFAAGDMILVRQEDSYALGDIVTFRQSSGSVITHRIVGSVEGQFITQGDANNVEDDQLLPPENILGKLRLVLPGAGSTVLFFRSPLGLLILLAAGILLIKLPDWVGALKTRSSGRHSP